MPKTRVFVSFDFDNDKTLKEFIIGQSRLADSPFEVADWSMKEAAPQRNWEQEAERRIKSVDVVIVMVGPQTYRAQGVLKEVAMARSAGKPMFQIIGYKDASPRAVANAGRLYKWDWNNLKRLLS
jgi:hypothetical protein